MAATCARIIDDIILPLEKIFVSPDYRKEATNYDLSKLERIIENLIENVSASEGNEEQEVQDKIHQITLNLSQYIRKRYGEWQIDNSGKESSGTIAIPEERKLKVVWDLDDCLISSTKISVETDPNLNTTVETREGGLAGSAIIHVDDDLIKFRTTLRMWARLVLTMLSPFCRQYVFTSATRGYMENVVSLIEAGYPADQRRLNEADYSEESNISLFPFFERRRLSISDFLERRHLRSYGKDVNEVIHNSPAWRSFSENRRELEFCERVVLLDDKATYHIAQPLHGIQVMPFGENDVELLLKFPLLIRVLTAFDSSHSSNVNLRSILAEAQTEEYWEGILRRLALNFGYRRGLHDKNAHKNFDHDNNTKSFIVNVNVVPEPEWLNNVDLVWEQMSVYLEEWSRAKGVTNGNPSTEEQESEAEWMKKLRLRWGNSLKKRRKVLVDLFIKEYKRVP